MLSARTKGSDGMEHLDLVLHDLIDSLETAGDEDELQGIAERLVHRIGFRWFAYLCIAEDGLRAISSYPMQWTRRYVEKNYECVDPVVAKAKATQQAFAWDNALSSGGRPAEQRLFWEASQFGIRSGVTIPIRGGFGRFASFTFATNEDDIVHESCKQALDILEAAVLYYHVHAQARLQIKRNQTESVLLTQRERQCLWWTARGKKMPEIASILGVSKRTVVFHLENARAKLKSATITQAVAQALQRQLILS
jgi:LuxR family transcriptional regulator, activator of conjugal transfer of Ti plasmids